MKSVSNSRLNKTGTSDALSVTVTIWFGVVPLSVSVAPLIFAITSKGILTDSNFTS